MAIVYQLIHPKTRSIYYVGYTERPILERLANHIVAQTQKTTRDLIEAGLMPIIEVIEEGINVTRDTETYWIQRYSAQGYYLENKDKVIKYQNRDYLYTLPTKLLNSIEFTECERYKAAIDLVLDEMPRYVSVPILMRIEALLNWAINPSLQIKPVVDNRKKYRNKNLLKAYKIAK